MKTRTFLLSLAAGAGLAAMAATGATQAWRDVLDTPALQTPLAARGLLNALALAGTRIVAAGQRGHIVWSDDAGRNWQQAEVPASSDLVALHFPTPLLGWAVGHDGIVLHTADGGKHWARQRDGRPGAADVPLLDVWFEDARTGYAVGAFGLLLRTTDGGTRWEPAEDMADNPKKMHLYAVRAIGEDLYIAGEQGVLLKLDRAAGRFRAIELPYKGTLFGLAGRGRTVVAHGLRGNLVRSSDGGATWQHTDTGVPAGLTASAIDSQGRIYLASQAGHVLASTDDGASFAPLKIEKPFPAAALLAADARTIVVAGPRGVQVQPLP